MPNQRKAGKKLMGAMASAELWDGVDQWLDLHPESSVSTFLLTAIIEKLEREGVAIDKTSALRDGRSRPARRENTLLNSKGFEVSSKVADAAARGAKIALSLIGVSPTPKSEPSPATDAPTGHKSSPARSTAGRSKVRPESLAEAPK